MTATVPEYRNFDWFDPEIRAETDDGIINITGYGAVFNKWYPVYDFQERVAPSAFNKTLRDNPDIRGMFNHDPNYLLGRTESGTMTVETDRKGMRYAIKADAQDPNSASVARKIERGDVDGSSMMFFVIKDEWQTKTENGIETPTKRTITELQLIETGPVVLPASPTTTAKVKRMAQSTGLDFEELEGIFIKFRAGFLPQGEQSELVKRSIETLNQLLEAEPVKAIVPDHSESTQNDNAAEVFDAFLSRATVLQFELAQIQL